MKISVECLPCILRQVLEAAGMTTENTELQEKIMIDAIKVLEDYKQYQCSPDISRTMHQIVKDYTGVADPYAAIKENDIKVAKKVYPVLQNLLKNKQNSLYWVLKAAAVGNNIDSAVSNSVDIEKCIEEEFEKEFSICDIDVFEEELKTAKSLLIIGDNAGETVFDRFVAEHLSHLDITYAVRSEPILNDATVEDAYESGLGHCTHIIASGCNTPGTILSECSEEFYKVFMSADIIISKGQGNFEALSGYVPKGHKVFYLLKAKCPVISKQFSVNIKDYVFMYGGR